MGLPRTLAALAQFQAESAAYVAVGQVTSLRRGRSLWTDADAVAPFQPSALWLYLSFIPFCLTAIHDVRGLRRSLRMMACVLISSVVCYRSFLRFPSPYPRPPVSVSDPGLERAWRSLRDADGPANTFPSIHVGHAMLIARMLARELPEEDADARMLWALLVSLSTLTAKQHFVVDVAGGVLVAEAIARHVYEPWDEGRLSLRTAWREVRRLCRRLDAAARRPGGLRLRRSDVHPRLHGLVEASLRHRSLSAVCARSPGRLRLLEQERLLAAELRRARLVVTPIVASAPEWLQFLRLVESADGHLTDEAVLEHVAALDPGLVAALDAVFPGAAPARAQPTSPQAMAPASGATT